MIHEVREVIFSIDADSAPSLDGVSSLFYECCWEIIQDVMRLELCWTSLLMAIYLEVLLLLLLFCTRKEKACKWTDFRPISLCIMFNKLIAKILNNWLSSVLPRIISLQQSGFIPGCLIGDNALLAHEVLYTLDTKLREGNTVLKLDRVKAYDYMEWSFLYSILDGFGLTGSSDASWNVDF